MKTEGHPKVSLCEVSCTCGNKFHIMYKKPTLTVDICSGCHPFYTGTQKFVDSAGRVDAFTKRFEWNQDKAKVKATQKLDFKKVQGPQEDLKTALERKRLFSAKREIPIPDEKEERGGRGGFGGGRGGGRGRGGEGRGRKGEAKEGAPAEAKSEAKAEAKPEAKPEAKG